MKNKQTLQERFDALTDEQKQSLKKIYKRQWLCFCVAGLLFLLTAAGVLVAFTLLKQNMASAIHTCAILCICGAGCSFVLLLATDIFFKRKYPYYSDKLYRFSKKAK